MKSSLKIKIFLIITFGIVFSASIISISNQFADDSEQSVNRNNDLDISTISGKIHIDNNWTDTKTAGICTGQGTESDPYFIEDLIIDGGGIGSCILIGNSTEYFTIENCTLTNWGIYYYDAGIKIVAASNGNLTQNQFSNPDAFGIVLYESNNNDIARNLISAERGLSVRFSNSNIVYLNNFINSMYNVELHNSTGNIWSTLKKMKYIYNSDTFSSRLGNYWSKFGGIDNNNNGIGDNPVIMDQHLPSSQWIYTDYYPLITPIANYEILGVASDAAIPSYHIILILSIFSIISIILLKKTRKLQK